MTTRDTPHALGVIIHHFVGERHPYVQGAMTSDSFDRFLTSLGKDALLDPEEWIERSLSGRLRSNDRCLTFDDALLSQMDIALPVLEHHGVKAFFYVYSSVFRGKLELFEIIRYFRNTQFGTVDAFYEGFYDALASRPDWPHLEKEKDSGEAQAHLSSYAFYSEADRRFRYLRDRVLSADDYNATCLAMMERMGYDPAQAARAIWMTESDLCDLQAKGHCVGLHSETHPTNLGTWSRQAQEEEYATNLSHLTKVLGGRPQTVAYPSGSYNDDTLSIMRDMDVVIGFMSGHEGDPKNLLEQPRLDWTQFDGIAARS